MAEFHLMLAPFMPPPELVRSAAAGCPALHVITFGGWAASAVTWLFLVLRSSETVVKSGRRAVTG